MRKILCSLITLLFMAGLSAADKVPSWFEHSDALYPSELYIKAEGEGNSQQEAEFDCISKISFFFNTTTDVVNKLSRTMSETTGSNYSSSSRSTVDESTKVKSQAEFLGLQWEKPFKAGNKYYAFGFIERESVFGVYKQRIDLNCGKLESLLLVAEDYNNPIYGIEAAKNGTPIAEMVEAQVSMARVVKKVSSNYFSEAESLCKRIRTALEICKANLVFQISVDNDYNGLIKRTVGKLLESQGYNISEYDGVCFIPVEITVTEENLPAGVFLYGGIEVNVENGAGEKVFSWSRNIPKTGAPGGRKEMAKKLMYQKMQKELEENFLGEFMAKISK